LHKKIDKIYAARFNEKNNERYKELVHVDSEEKGERTTIIVESLTKKEETPAATRSYSEIKDTEKERKVDG